MKKVIAVFLLVIVVGCVSKNEAKPTIIIEKNDFYKQSEMAALMLLMYEVNEENKKLILEGKQPKDFPPEFLNIHSAQLTNPSDRTGSFEDFSNLYLVNMRNVFEPSQESLKAKHNTAINSCIACHQTTCIGPIPKIKKLLIP